MRPTRPRRWKESPPVVRTRVWSALNPHTKFAGCGVAAICFSRFDWSTGSARSGATWAKPPNCDRKQRENREQRGRGLGHAVQLSGCDTPNAGPCQRILHQEQILNVGDAVEIEITLCAGCHVADLHSIHNVLMQP